MMFVVRVSGCLWSSLLVGVWEDRAVLARLKQKLQTEDGRLILRIEQEDWKVPAHGTDARLICSGPRTADN